MTQNTSSAVMQQRNAPRNQGLDDFPTPPWATRALIEHVIAPFPAQRNALKHATCLEPAANRGFMVRPLQEYFGGVYASDVHDYGCGYRVDDFLFTGYDQDEHDWIITNPPFRLASAFADRCALNEPRMGYALLTRIAFLEGVDRYKALFRDHPPSIVAQFAERVPMVEGRFDPEASTATAYCWLVWFTGYEGLTHLQWIPPCRRQLQRDTDLLPETSHV